MCGWVETGRTKNTISLRLWSAEVLASDFDLEAFNAGDHERAAAAQADATKVRQDAQKVAKEKRMVGFCQDAEPVAHCTPQKGQSQGTFDLTCSGKQSCKVLDPVTVRTNESNMPQQS